MNNPFSYLLKIIYRFRFPLLIVPIVVTILAYLFIKRAPDQYMVSSSIYTGVASGFNINSTSSNDVDWNSVNNAIDNLISIIKSQVTLEEVALKLYARNMVHGSPTENNNYITSRNYNALYNITPPDVRKLIDRKSEEKTYENIRSYAKANRGNFIYGLLNYKHPHYSFTALSQNIQVKRVFNSDMLEISYVNDDPGIAYNTVLLLNEVFVKEYTKLRDGEVLDVVKYFREQLRIIGDSLRRNEDELMRYSTENRIINYDEQTKLVATLSRDFNTRYEEILLAYTSSQKLIQDLESRIQDHLENLKSNKQFSHNIEMIDNLQREILKMEMAAMEGKTIDEEKLFDRKHKLDNAEKEMYKITREISAQLNSKEGVSTSEMVSKWLNSKITYSKSKAELDVMAERKKYIDDQILRYSPIGSNLKRRNREINFSEQTYTSNLYSLNTALMRQKSLQMSSASLNVLTPPLFPIMALSKGTRKVLMLAFIGSIVFIIALAVLIELLDRTLKNPFKASILMKHPISGAFPKKMLGRNLRYQEEYNMKSIANICNHILTKFESVTPNIINVISNEQGDGKSHIVSQLFEYWSYNGVKTKVLSWNDEVFSDVKKNIFSKSIFDFYEHGDEEILIVEYPPLSALNVSHHLFKEANVNLFIARADKVWKSSDIIFFNQLKKILGEDSNLEVILNKATVESVEEYTGMLPPYSFLKSFVFKLSNFGFTAKA